MIDTTFNASYRQKMACLEYWTVLYPIMNAIFDATTLIKPFNFYVLD